MFQYIKLWLENQMKLSTNDVVEILQQFETFTSNTADSPDKKGL